MPIVPDEYHACKSVDAEALIRATKVTRPGQIECFEDQTGEYIILSWLTTARIFRYSDDVYRETARIPSRYVDISPNIITCLHYSDGKIYLAYLWGKTDRRPYVELRDTAGQTLDDPLLMDEESAVDMMYSDKDYVYLKTTEGAFHIHRKQFFGIIHYRVDFQNFIGLPIHRTWVENPKFDSYTRMPLVSACRDQVLVTQYDVLSHKIRHCYRFDDGYNTVSMAKIGRIYIIHRKLGKNSIIDLGCTGKNDGYLVFLHQSRIKFADTSSIIQVKVTDKFIYVFGSSKFDDLKKYEIGCLQFPQPRPLWVSTVKEADENCLIVPHSSGICLVKGGQRISYQPIPKIRNISHQTNILSDVAITTRNFLAQNSNARSSAGKLNKRCSSSLYTLRQ